MSSLFGRCKCGLMRLRYIGFVAVGIEGERERVSEAAGRNPIKDLTRYILILF